MLLRLYIDSEHLVSEVYTQKGYSMHLQNTTTFHFIGCQFYSSSFGNFKMVSSYLSFSGVFKLNLPNEDLVAMTCYKKHKENQTGPHLHSNCRQVL